MAVSALNLVWGNGAGIGAEPRPSGSPKRAAAYGWDLCARTRLTRTERVRAMSRVAECGTPSATATVARICRSFS